MTIYIDLVFIINLFFDYLLLLTVNVTLKRKVKLSRILLGSLIGSITLITLFLPINNVLLFFLKIFVALFMCIASFGYKNFRYTIYNLIYLYMSSIILGGALYYLNIEANYNHDGLMFYYNGLGFNYIFLIIITPIVLYFFIKSIKYSKIISNYYYSVVIEYNGNILSLTGFMDTGNRAIDPITHKPIIIINKRLLKGKFNIRSPMYVGINTVKGHTLMECFKPTKLIVNNITLTNCLIGISETANGIDCLLNYNIMEAINV